MVRDQCKPSFHCISDNALDNGCNLYIFYEDDKPRVKINNDAVFILRVFHTQSFVVYDSQEVLANFYDEVGADRG